MFNDTTTTPVQTTNESPSPSRWRCSKCGTEFHGMPQERLLDAHDRWRRDHCQHCKRTMVMERA